LGNRFVDRDMYMRYAGGGVGHYRVTLLDSPADASDTREDFAMDEEVEEAEHILDDSIVEDHSSDSEAASEEEEEDNPDEDLDDLGAEDGEEGFADAEDDEGYAVL
jgi:hypothetical protein